LSGPTIVVGAGFLGRSIADAVVRSGGEVVLVARRPGPHRVGVRVVVDDLGDGETLRSVIGPGSTVVFAAGTSVPSVDERDPIASTRALAPLVATLQAARHVPGSSLLFVSSGGAVYGEVESLPISEDHPLRPRSAYGAAKAAAEAYVGYFARRYGLAATSMRCGNVYGPGQRSGRGQGLVGEVLDAAVNGSTIEVWGDGTCRRDYIHVADVARTAVRLIGRNDLPPAINVGSGQGTTVLEVIHTVGEVIGRPVRWTSCPERPFDVHDVVLDIRRLSDLTGVRPVGLADGVLSTWLASATETVA